MFNSSQRHSAVWVKQQLTNENEKFSFSNLGYRSNRQKQNVIIQIRNFLWHWGHQLCYSQKGQWIFIDHMQPRTLLYALCWQTAPQAHGLQTPWWWKFTTKLGSASGLQKHSPSLLILLFLGSKIRLITSHHLLNSPEKYSVSDVARVYIKHPLPNWDALLFSWFWVSWVEWRPFWPLVCCDVRISYNWRPRDTEVEQSSIHVRCNLESDYTIRETLNLM